MIDTKERLIGMLDNELSLWKIISILEGVAILIIVIMPVAVLP